MADEWYRWLDSKPLPALIDGGLGHMLEERGSKLDYGTLWTAALLVTDPKEVSCSTQFFTNTPAICISVDIFC